MVDYTVKQCYTKTIETNNTTTGHRPERITNMKFTNETIKKVVQELKKAGNTEQDIEDNFKVALKANLIGIDVYYIAMEEIYA